MCSCKNQLLTVMIYCWMVSKGVSGEKEFVNKLPSGRRNWSRAEMLSKNKKSLLHVQSS